MKKRWKRDEKEMKKKEKSGWMWPEYLVTAFFLCQKSAKMNEWEDSEALNFLESAHHDCEIKKKTHEPWESGGYLEKVKFGLNTERAVLYDAKVLLLQKWTYCAHLNPFIPGSITQGNNKDNLFETDSVSGCQFAYKTFHLFPLDNFFWYP